MLYREVIAVCSEIHTKHANTLCGQKAELLNVKLALQIVTIGFYPRNTQLIITNKYSNILNSRSSIL